MKITFVGTNRHQNSQIEPGEIKLSADYSERATVSFEFIMELDEERPTKPEPEEVWMDLDYEYQRMADRTWKRLSIIGEYGSGDVREVHDMKWDRYDSDVQDKYVALADALFEPPVDMNELLEKRRSDAITVKIAALENQIENLKRIM